MWLKYEDEFSFVNIIRTLWLCLFDNFEYQQAFKYTFEIQ